MRVLFINTVYEKGSTGRIVADLGKMLEENGHAFKVAYGRGDHRSDPHCYKVGSDLDVYIHAGLSRITDRAGFYSSGATRKLVRFIKEYDPDIIHLHNLHGYYLNIEILFKFLADEYRGRVIWTLHDCWAFTGHCVHFTYAGCDRWKIGCQKCPQKTEYPASYLIDNSTLNYRRKKTLFTSVKDLEIITVSDWLKRMAEVSFLKEKSITRIYNGIDTTKFRPTPNRIKEELGILGKKMILLVSDGWIEQKGYSTVLEVAKAAPADWRFVMVGLTKKQIAALPENCIGFERIWDQAKLIEFYSAADVFFNPSIEETFGLVTAEAIACGTPAVVMDSTACPELVRSEGSGIVLSRGSSVQQIIRGIDSLTLEKRPSELPERFSKKTFLKQYYAFYLQGEE